MSTYIKTLKQDNDQVLPRTRTDAVSLTDNRNLQTVIAGLESGKQDKLPQVVNDRFLHTNAQTGALEWEEASGSQVAIQTTEPTDEDVVLWINPDESGSSIDSVPTQNSTNAVSSGGTYDAIQGAKAYAIIQDGKRTRNNITNNLANLTTAIAEQNLEKYGYAIGDYFNGASGYTYHLADMDTYYGGYNNQAVVSRHHCGIVVDTKSSSQWLSSGNAPRYDSSTLHSYLTNTALPNVKNDITALFGDWSSHLISHEMLANGIGTWGWSGENYIRAMSEVEVYSSRIWSADNYQQGEAVKPLTLFQKFRFNEIYGNVIIWLRSLYSASHACPATNSGNADHYPLSDSHRASGLILLK